jgi:predicted  nucleic acid-binding Zn-ribbon protein
MRRRLVLVSLVLLLVLGAFATSTVARQARPDPDVLSALLVEVRGLRAAMEQMSSATARVQLAMGRLQLNEQRITTYMRRLDEIRDRRLPAEREVQKYQKELSEQAEALRLAVPPIPQESNDFLKQLKGEMARANAYLQRLQTEEAQLMRDIATEQDRWAEINRTLEELDRALIRR